MIKYIAILILILILNFLGVSENVLSENDDYIQTDKKKIQSTLSTRDKILQNFVFLGDFYTRNIPITPKLWLNKTKNPLKHLLLGKPISFKIPKLKLNFPIFLLNSASYLNGDNLGIQKLNAALEYWYTKDYQKSANLFHEAKNYFEKDNNKILEFVMTNIYESFFYFQLIAEKSTAVNVFDKKSAKNPFSDEQIYYALARLALYKAFNSIETSKYVNEMNIAILPSIFNEQFSSVLYLNEDNFSPIALKRNQFILNKTSENVQILIRSLVISALWNMTIVNGTTVLWGRSLLATKKMTNILNIMKKYRQQNLNYIPFLKDDIFSYSSSIKVWPQTFDDVLSLTHSFKAYAFLSINDPKESLTEISKAIQIASSYDLKALGFYLSAAQYMELNNFNLAIKSSAWCEAMEGFFSTDNPICLLIGAEATFWQGKFTIAEKAYQKTLTIAGENNISPFLRLRLAEINLFNNNIDKSLNFYDEIIRLYYDHEVYNDALVRSFCLETEKQLPEYFVRQKNIHTIKQRLIKMRDSLAEEAKTCILKNELQNLADNSSPKSNLIVKNAEAQIQLYNDLNKEYPDSSYLTLFEERIKKLRIAYLIESIDNDNCDTLLNLYLQNLQPILTINNNDNKILHSLRWTKEENKQVLKCSAYKNNLILWEQFLQNSQLKTEGQPYSKLLLNWHKNKNNKNLIELLNEIIKNNKNLNWINLAKEMDKQQNKSVRSDNFWLALAIKEIIKFDLLQSNDFKNKIMKTFLTEFLKNLQLSLSEPVICNWFNNNFNAFSIKDYDNFVVLYKSKNLLSLLFKSETNCQIIFAKKLLEISIQQNSKIRDKEIVLPYLEKLTPKNAPLEWLRYVQRLEKLYGWENTKVKGFYKYLSTDSSEKSVKEIAKIWLEQSENTKFP